MRSPTNSLAADYASYVLMLEPVAYWRLGETNGGTARDIAGVSESAVSQVLRRLARLLREDATVKELV